MDTKKLRQKILDLAIHGKLVPQDPNDEPASVLLERIRKEKEQLIKEGKIKKCKKSAKTSACLPIGTDTPHYENAVPDGCQVPFEVPNGWVWTTLGEILSVKSGDNINVRQLDCNDSIPVYGGNGISGYYTQANVTGHTIVIGRVGFYCGSVHKTKGNAWVTDNAFIVSFSESHINKNWLSYLLKGLCLGNYSNSTAQPVISGKTIYPIHFLLPPLKEQQRIVAEIERWFSLIDIIEQGKDNLQATIAQAKSKILDLAIHGKLVPQDPNDEPAIELLKRIKPGFTPCDNAHYPQLPEGWCICRLSDVVRICDNLRKPINSAERSERIANKTMTELYPYYGATGMVGYIDEYLIDGDYILLGEDGAPFLDKYASKAYIVKGKSWVNNHAHILQPLSNFEYMCYYLNAIKYDDYVNGSTRLKLTQADMKNICVALPPMDEQSRIVSVIRNTFEQLNGMMESL